MPAPPNMASEDLRPPQDAPPRPSKLRRRIIPVLAVLLVLSAGGFTVWKVFLSKPKPPDNVVALSGRVEGDDSAVSPKPAGESLKSATAKGTW